MKKNKKHVFIIGSKGIPSAYGGFETFVDKLTEYQVSDEIQYHVACMGEDYSQFEYNGARCFKIKVPNIGPAKAIYYDLKALRNCIVYCKKHQEIKNPIIYILACRIGPFIKYYKRQMKKIGAVLYINPDGHEWKRAKWNALVRKYWKISENLMVKHADLLICDSKNIEKYIHEDYKRYCPNTTYIAYGSDIQPSALRDDDIEYHNWLQDKGLKEKEYYLVVGRFVPENNFETMIREFMSSDSKKHFAIITTTNDSLLEELERKLSFESDNRVKFVGTVYDYDLLKKIRENAYGYFHGHEVGGTNPSLLEALASTDLNLLLDVGFNREVGEEAALYWKKDKGCLSKLINMADEMSESEVKKLGMEAKKRILDAYSWECIVEKYETIFLAKM